MRDTRCALVNERNNIFVFCRQKFPIEDYDITPHAVIGALSKARAKSIEGGTAYVNVFPCAECAKALAAAGIRKVVYEKENDHQSPILAIQIFTHFGIDAIKNEELDF